MARSHLIGSGSWRFPWRTGRVGRNIQKFEFGCLGDGLLEVRSDMTDGKIARVIFTVVRERMVILHGFIKKTKKTPVQDLRLALKRMREVS